MILREDGWRNWRVTITEGSSIQAIPPLVTMTAEHSASLKTASIAFQACPLMAARSRIRHTPVAAYSQAVEAGDLVFVSGQIPMDPKTGHLTTETIEAATLQSLSNVRNILESADLGFKDVVKATIFMIDSEDYGGMDATYRQVMPEPFPAREAVFVRGLPKNARVEISVIAHRNR